LIKENFFKFVTTLKNCQLHSNSGHSTCKCACGTYCEGKTYMFTAFI